MTSQSCSTCGGPPHALCCPAYEAHVRGLRGDAVVLVEEPFVPHRRAAAETLEVLRAARQRPPMPEDERAHMVALAEEASEERCTTEEVMATLEAVLPGRDFARALVASEALRPLPPGAPEAVAHLVGELRAAGVEVGVLRQSEALPGELGSVPRPIEAAIDAFQRSLNGVGGRPGRHRRELRSAIRAELDACEQRLTAERALRWAERKSRAVASTGGCMECAGHDEADARTTLKRAGGLVDPEDADPRTPLLDVDLTLEQLSAALAQLDVLRRLLTITRAELAEQRERHLEHRQDLHKALSERDAWRARAETAERELAALRPAPAPVRITVAPFCFGCGESHSCACTRAGSQ